jgi:hypothetical protein
MAEGVNVMAVRKKDDDAVAIFSHFSRSQIATSSSSVGIRLRFDFDGRDMPDIGEYGMYFVEVAITHGAGSLSLWFDSNST